MFLTGFADEAGASIDAQIEATRALGWKFIETRNVDGKNLSTMSDAEFDVFAGKLADAGIRINSYGSPIANWTRAPRSDADFETDKKDLLAAIPRMKRLGTKLLRGMSYKLTGDEKFDSPELEKIIFRKVGELVKICADNGIVYGHENCMNYAGQSFVHTLRLLDAVKSDNLKLIFDTGNPVFTFRRIGQEPFPLQSAYEFYDKVREFITYVHIKDCVCTVRPDGKTENRFTFAGDGCGCVRPIVADLLKNGYDGGFSMEPHIAVIFHEQDNAEDDAIKARRRIETYIEYGRRFEALLKEYASAQGRKLVLE